MTANFSVIHQVDIGGSDEEFPFQVSAAYLNGPDVGAALLMMPIGSGSLGSSAFPA